MVTAVTSTPKQCPSQNPKRPPLLSSGSDNAPPRRPKAREVSSRYLSLSTSSSSSNSSASTNTTLSSVTSGSSVASRRSQSPMLSRSVSVATPKSQQRAVSAERRRQGVTTPSNAERMLVTSMRSLSVSFQGEPYSLPVSKVKPPPATAGTPGGLRKGTPERKKAGVTPVRDRRERDRENSRPSDHQQHRWPGRLRGKNSSFFTRSLDYGTGRVKLSGSGSALKELRKSVGDENSRNKVSNDLKLENHDVDVRGTSELNGRPRLGESRNSDAESVSSESTASGNVIQLRGGPRGVVVPGRFSQDASNRVHKVLDPGSPLSNSASNRTLGHSKLIVAKKFQNDSPVSSPREVFASRGLSPLRGGMRAASPSKALTSSGALLRGMASPTRARSGVGTSMSDSNTCSTPSLLSFAVDIRKGKLGENRIADAHNLRLLYNRLLQWRLANAKVENTLLVQEQTAQRSLYTAWMTTSKLRHSVGSKRIELQLLRLNVKLYSILKEQEPHLESWGSFERDHCNSLSGAIEALEASTIRLPLVGGARV
ncbi:UNVERIFIED_CONTAM: QWRF motif-containing protein 2 [Sesamum radiatum]|uniref:QWRF motif-containing protein 2 n=1 Tax=Sesamum radiatum TaxID=300843 RepID=A0AAW2Q036_SESRA